MYRGLFALVAAGMLCLGAPSSSRADVDRGEALYRNHCTACHDSVAHIRARRSVDTLAELHRETQRWSRELGLAWTRAEVDAVVDYLDRTYYRFQPPTAAR